MPLSEDEQRILRQIEEQLQRDTGFGRKIETVRNGSRRALVVASSATVLGLLLTVATLGVSPLLSFCCFVATLAAAVVAVRHAGRDFAHLSATAGVRTGREAATDDDRH